MKKIWSEDDIAYLEENWGKLSIATLMKKLNASKREISDQATSLNLGRWLDSCEFISLCQFAGAIGVDRRQCERTLTAKQFPIEFKQFDKVRYKVIDIDEFWKWAETHQDVFSFKNFQRGALGKEPPWVDVKRRANIRNHGKKHMDWSKTDEALLKSMLSARRYTYSDLSERLQRTELAIKNHIVDLGLPDRPLRKPYRKWTDEELTTLKSMRSNHCSYGEIGKALCRSEFQVRSKVEQMLNPNFKSKKDGSFDAAIHTQEWHRVAFSDFVAPKPPRAKKKRTSKKKG